MSIFYIGPWVPGDGRLDHWRAPAWASGAIDLRASATGPGLGFFATSEPVSDSDYVRTVDGDGDTWRKMLGIYEKVRGGTVAEILRDVLTIHSGDGIDRVKPLMPTRNGRLEINVGRHGRIYEEKMPRDVTKARHWPQMQRVLHDGFRQIAAQSAKATTEKGSNTHRRYLGDLAQKFGMSHEAATALLIPSDMKKVAPLVPETVITESFDKANSTTLGPDLTWSELQGDQIVSGNKVRGDPANSGVAWAQATSDLSSSDQYAQIAVYGASFLNAVGSRLASGINAYEAIFIAPNSARIVKTVSGTRTTIDLVTQSTVDGDVMRIEVNGSSLTLLWNGSSILGPLTDTDVASGTRCGVMSVDDRGDLDNFEAGDLGGGGGPTSILAQLLQHHGA